MLGVSSKEKTQEKTPASLPVVNVRRQNAQYLGLRDEPSTSGLCHGPCLTASSIQERNDVKAQMKNIDSEITALLRSDEKNLKTAIAFTIKEDDRERSRTPGVAPRRLIRKEKAEVITNRFHEMSFDD